MKLIVMMMKNVTVMREGVTKVRLVMMMKMNLM